MRIVFLFKTVWKRRLVLIACKSSNKIKKIQINIVNI